MTVSSRQTAGGTKAGICRGFARMNADQAITNLGPGDVRLLLECTVTPLQIRVIRVNPRLTIRS